MNISTTAYSLHYIRKEEMRGIIKAGGLNSSSRERGGGEEEGGGDEGGGEKGEG
jgi:hypothetical protein